MDDLVDTATWQYAVISVRTEPGRERLVIAYPDEETLPDLIAEPSIVALGYTSRAHALKNMDRCVTIKASLEQQLRTAIFCPNVAFLTECRVALQRLATAFAISGTSKIMRNLLYTALAAALSFFYSRNVLSSAVRAFISV